MSVIGQRQGYFSPANAAWVVACLWGVLSAVAFAADVGGTTDTLAGIDESEWRRLRRTESVLGGQPVPEFLSPEAVAGLPVNVADALQREFVERGRVQVESDRYLDYDEERNVIYSSARTRIRFDRYLLEADRVLINVALEEFQAEGNVVLHAWEDASLQLKTSEIYCKAMIFNYRRYQGAAYEARGQYNVMYFKCLPRKDSKPGLEIVGRDEAIFRDVQFTTCDFPEPHYCVRTKEAVLLFNDRIFIRKGILYLRKLPVFFLPYYTRSLREVMPWNVKLGYSGRLGAYASVRYSFWQYRYEPSFDDPEKLEMRDQAHVQPSLDLFGKRGVGIGFAYDYSFDFGKHKGDVALYLLPSDRYRNVPEDRQAARWQAFARHRSELRKDLTFHFGLDYMSDPEFYYDLMDPRERYDRGRVPERRARAALTYWKDDYIARALFEIKERITRDRITNTLEPTDDDADYDLYPGQSQSLRHRSRQGLPSSRYGIVSMRLPQLTFSTNHIRIGGNTPLFYALDINAFNNLDKGLNFRSTRDDSFVLGLDIYQQIGYLFRLSERYTLLAQIGAGIGAMKRLDDSWHLRRSDFRREDGTFRSDISFVDDNTFRVNDNIFGLSDGLLGLDPATMKLGGKEVSLDDYSPFFAYADIKLRFQGRFTDSLTGNIYYILREGSDQSLSEFYESIGNRTAREDLYNYRIRQHWLYGDLTYRLAYPNIVVAAYAGRNLQSRSDIYASELIQYAALTAFYRNQARTFLLGASLRYEQRQIRDPDNPWQYRRDYVLAGLQAAYVPVHRRWWIEGDLFVIKALDDDPKGQISGETRYSRRFYSDYYFFYENQTDVLFDIWVGRKLGEKWTVEIGSEFQQYYGGWRDARLILTRDLHDAVAQLRARYRRSPWRQRGSSSLADDLSVDLDINFKLPGPVETVRASRARILMIEQRTIQLAEDPVTAAVPPLATRPLSAL